MILSVYDLMPTSQSLSLPAPLEALLSLCLAIGLMLLGLVVGAQLLAWLRIKPVDKVEQIVLACGLGLGALGYGFLVLGLLGLLRVWTIWVFLAAIAAWAGWRWRRLVSPRPDIWTTLRPQNLFERVGGTLLVIMLLAILLRSLTPVTDYDGLAYHLVVPRDYLEAGRIFPVPGEAHANFPLTAELLFLPAISLGLESAAQLIHASFAALMALGVWALGRRILNSRHGGWIAILVLGTTPLIGTIGSYVHHDLVWALFEFLAVYALLVWTGNQEKAWLILAGIMAGLGLGSKYLGLPVLGVLGLALLVHSLLMAGHSWRTALLDGMLFGIVAVIVAAPWYLKNWLWLGNPVYPLWFGGKGWDPFLSFKLEFMGTNYGPRQGILGLLLLPLDIFIYSAGYFGPVPFAFPSPLVFVLPFYLAVRRHQGITLILLICTLRFGTWVLSARNLRYLLDIYPLLGIAVAYVLVKLATRRWAKVLGQALVLTFLVANLAWQMLLVVQADPLPVVLGRQSHQDYLSIHDDPPYRTIYFLNSLPPGSKTLFVGNGQSYYATGDHISDVNHSNWGHLIYKRGQDPVDLRQALVEQKITHIFFSAYDFTWQMNFDFGGHLSAELATFEEFASRCTSLVYDQGEEGQVYALLDQCR